MSNPETESEIPAIGEHEKLTVRLPTFEGPLDLLLHLIRKHELDIYDIPIVLVTEQYIEYLNLMKELNLDLAGEYLVMAATLIHIKSRMLLPQDATTETGVEDDPRAELVRQLLEYEKFKRVADVLYEKDRVERATHPRGTGPEFEVEEDVLVEASLFDLVAAFKELVEERKRAKPFTVDDGQSSVADRVAEILVQVTAAERVGFRDLFPPAASRNDWIVTFLAILELARMQAVRILQRVAGGEIILERREASATAELGVLNYGQQVMLNELEPIGPAAVVSDHDANDHDQDGHLNLDRFGGDDDDDATADDGFDDADGEEQE